MFCTFETCFQNNLLLVILFYITNLWHVFFLLFLNDPDNYLVCFWIVQFVQLVQYP